MRLIMGFTLTVAAVLILLANPIFAEETKAVEKPDFPEPVLKAFQKSFPDVEVSGYEKEVVDEQVYYEIETIADELEKVYIYLEDGTLYQIEEEISEDVIPEPVIKAVNKAFPKCEIDEAEKIIRGSTIEYEIVIEVDEEEFELLVSSEGKILASDQADDEDEDIDEDEDDDGSDDDDAGEDEKEDDD